MIQLTMARQVNQQPAEKRDEDSGEQLDIVSVFQTIQGEGPFVGHPAVFVRLAGCSILCPSCDTDYTSKRTRVPVVEIVRSVLRNSQGCGGRSLVVITGGEPFRQNCGPLVRALGVTHHVQFETNGTLYDPSMVGWWHHVTVVCSPKTGSVNDRMKPVISHLKYVLEAGKIDGSDGLPLDSLNFGVRPCRPWEEFQGRVYVQPLTTGVVERDKANKEAAIKSCMDHGYVYSYRLHVELGMP